MTDNPHECPHPTSTATTDGAVGGVRLWCSNCGAAHIQGKWVVPRMGKSGKNCHASRSRHGGYPLPTKEQYVAAGYKAENYERFMEEELSPVPKDGL